MAGQVSNTGSGSGGLDASSGSGGSGSSNASFEQNLSQLKQVSEQSQANSMKLRAESTKLGSDQNAAKERPQA